MKEQKVFISQAHPDDETMIRQHVDQLLDRGFSIQLCIAVNGGAGNIYGIRPEVIWGDPNIGFQKAAEIRRNELTRAVYAYSPAGKVTFSFLDLIDKGWRDGGLAGQEGKVKQQLLDNLGGYDAYIFPLSLPNQQAPGGWSHPDHLILSNTADDPQIQEVIGKKPMFRFILYNELLPLARLPQSITNFWQPEVWQYGRERFGLLRSVVNHCYRSQAKTLWTILALRRRDLFTRGYQHDQAHKYPEIGRRGPTRTLPFHEVIFSRNDEPTFSQQFGTPKDVTVFDYGELTSG